MPSELNEKQLHDLVEERAKIFTPGWFADLFGARLGFGDTFWLGNFAILLFVVPLVVLVAGVLYAQSAPAMMVFLRIAAGLWGLWLGVIGWVLWRVGPRGGWPVTGLVVTLASALYALKTALTL